MYSPAAIEKCTGKKTGNTGDNYEIAVSSATCNTHDQAEVGDKTVIDAKHCGSQRATFTREESAFVMVDRLFVRVSESAKGKLLLSRCLGHHGWIR